MSEVPEIYRIYVPGTGNPEPSIVFVGEAPSYEEINSLTPFVGPSGGLLDECLKVAGIKRSECWITNVSKYMVPPNRKYGKKIPFHIRAKSVGIDIERCIGELWEEINQLKPNIIVPLGGTALWALTGYEGIQSYRGSILSSHGYKIISSYHPAHILHQSGDVRGYWTKQILIHDLKRIRSQSGFKDIILPQRDLTIARSSRDFENFLNNSNGLSNPSVDIEALFCLPACIGLAFNKRKGITIPLWNHSGISSIPDSDLAHLWILLSNLLSSSYVVGQNFGYDRDKIKRFGFTVAGLKSDTMFKAFCINPELPKSLAFNTSIYTYEPFYKNEGMYEGSTEDLFIGCARDACVTKEVDDAMDEDIDGMQLREYYENFMLPLHDLYHFSDENDAIEQIGFKVDEDRRKELIEKYVNWDENCRYELFKLCGRYVNCNSWQQVSKLLFTDLGLPERKGTGEEELSALLLSPKVKDETHKRIITLILEDRRVRKTISSYLYSPTDFDGRMRTSFFLCLETGRSSTQQQDPPIRPDIVYDGREEGKKVKKHQSMGMAFQTITKHGDIGNDIRKMLVVDDGEIFLQADSSQAEARVIFLLAEDYQALKDIDEHDYHALTASWFFGGVEEDYSKKVLGYESPIRFAGKTLRHAGHLGASGRRAMIELNTQARKYKIDIQITEAKAKKALETFHAKQPKIKSVFQAEVIKCLSKNRRLIAPIPHGIKAKLGGTRIFFERWDDELFRQAFSYLPQRTVSENTKSAGLRIRKRARWIKIVSESHDALLVRVKIDRKEEAAKILKEEFEKPIDFSKCSLERGELVIPCEVEEGYDYKDLKKFKFLELN